MKHETSELTQTAKKALFHMLCRMRACWEQGICGYALMELGLDDLLLSVCHDLVDMQHPDGRLGAVHTNAQTDPALSIHSMLRAYALTGDERYGRAIERHREDIFSTPWRSGEGVLYHFKGSKKIWADSAAMLPAALAALDMKDAAADQLAGLCRRLQLPNGLYGHQWNDETTSWDRQASWSAGNGWILTGLAWTMALLGADHPRTQELMALYTGLTDALLPWRTADGLYHDVTDDSATFVECQTAAMQQYSRMVLWDAGMLAEDPSAEAMRVLLTITAHMNSLGAVCDTPGAPDFSHNGTSTEMQAFWLMLWQRLHKDEHIDL